MAKRHFRPSVFNGDKGHASRERRLERFNGELKSTLDWADYRGDKSPVVMPNEPNIQRRIAGTLLEESQYRHLGDVWRRMVDMGSQKDSNPKTIGKYQRPEPVTVTSRNGVMSGSYRNQNGNPISDAYSGKYKDRSAYKKMKRSFRKVVTQMTSDVKVDAASLAITLQQVEATHIPERQQSWRGESGPATREPEATPTRRTYSWDRR